MYDHLTEIPEYSGNSQRNQLHQTNERTLPQPQEQEKEKDKVYDSLDRVWRARQENRT